MWTLGWILVAVAACALCGSARAQSDSPERLPEVVVEGDFATTLDGVPVNLPSHGHGQGYTDLGFIGTGPGRSPWRRSCTWASRWRSPLK